MIIRLNLANVKCQQLLMATVHQMMMKKAYELKHFSNDYSIFLFFAIISRNTFIVCPFP
uniref:Uncharacterized protein n=1 Tax=Octopus bimaculoides TaxID=37653 RepID=A0A0L8HSJ9_OCTBM